MAGPTYQLSQVDPSAQQAPFDPFSNPASLLGTGIGIYNQQQQYQGLQNALQTVGPTNLNSWGLNGPGGMNTGYNTATGTGNINLGGLNPAFSGFSSAAGAGASGYNAGLPYGLSNNASSFLPMANGQLFGAYGNYGAGIGAANSQLPTASGANFNSTLGNLYGAYQQQLQPQIQQQAFGLQNTLFGNGVANSTGAASGSLAEQNFGRGVAQADAGAYTQAFQQALGQQNSAVSNYGQLSNSANGILNNALNNFGNTNTLISGLNTAGLTNAGTAASGAGALNTVGLNNYNASLQTGVGQGTVRNQSLFPYASLATAAYGKPSGLGVFGNALTQAGAAGGAGGFNIPGLNSGTLGSAYNWMTGGGGIDPTALAGYNSQVGSAIGDMGLNAGSGFTGMGDLGSGLAGDSTYQSALGMMGNGFSSAGGAAAAGTDAGGAAGLGGATADIGSAQATAGVAPEFAGYSASAGADAAGGAGAASGGLGAVAGGALGLAAVLGPVLYGMSQPPSQTNDAFSTRQNNAIKAGPGQFAGTQGFNGNYWDPQYMNYQAAKQYLSGTDWSSLVKSGAVPFAPGVSGGAGGAKNRSNF